ncbi:MAG TPA: 50S ribosomal protein L22 [Bacteroidota bacterium]|uniref:Large ribosomal subunit protein uL22 n=2 Tax=environmental samples TaxID=1645731 RepID=A0A0H4T2G6_9BACT|nr:50S ribosomal protein L22 [uncultured Ignavibacteria bacterium Rifle_16ft_4_minimus_28285]HLE33748.1 50S ribosomal protein L22 [Bacteroidota bacterium]
MEARAINRYVGSSPRKMRLVIDLIRGRGVEEALSILHFSPKHAARMAEKVLRSAISNFQNKDEAGRVDTARLFVKTAFVDGGPVAKRISPAPQGRAYRIRKRSNHITIVIAQREAKKVEVKPSAAKAASAAPGKEAVPAKAPAPRAKKKAGSAKKASKKS